ncbi:jg8514 [Pararge aegeria aegeria]|uniref:Jg8514 protein n=1 Tax=Pararge aegeria aegeria TaxID=348720 RepID=A0A8S4R9I8_9NEOP|nr:jg8514 [Pararge aegeria aegeria]
MSVCLIFLVDLAVAGYSPTEKPVRSKRSNIRVRCRVETSWAVGSYKTASSFTTSDGDPRNEFEPKSSKKRGDHRSELEPRLDCSDGVSNRRFRSYDDPARLHGHGLSPRQDDVRNRGPGS